MNFEGATHQPDMSATRRALIEEQTFVDTAYQALDAEYSYYEKQLAQVRAQGATGTPQARTERDSFATHYEDNVLRLRNVENKLVLGRLDYRADAVTESGTNSPSIHIGRVTLRDSDHNILLTDWRAPQSEAFYRATAAHPGNVARRRHIQTRFRTVTSVEDELLSIDGTHSDLSLTGEGALIAAMSQARDGKMGDIVATIQAEQDRVIRTDSKGILVVQGGPGTGKTAVALHRAAYLLYAERARLSNSGILVIGPSNRFLRYIDQVLPSLGESNVVASTMDDLLPGISVTATDSPHAADVKSRLIWQTIAKRAIPAILQKPLQQAITFKINGKNVHLTPNDVAEAQRRARQSGKAHNQARQKYATYLVELLARRLAEALNTNICESDWLIADVASDPDVRREVNKHWLPASPLWLLEHIYKWPEVLAAIAPELSTRDRAALHRERGTGVTAADVPLLDELAEHLGDAIPDSVRHAQDARKHSEQRLASYIDETMAAMGLGGGIVSSQTLVNHIDAHDRYQTMAAAAENDRAWTYGHIVIDEAQELTAMQWVMIARRNPARSMTIVGDLDQRIHATPGATWRSMLGALGTYAHVEELTISYRTPSNILDRAAAAMHAMGVKVRPVHGVRSIADSYRSQAVSPELVDETLFSAICTERDFLDTEYGEGLGTLAVITARNQRESVLAAVTAHATQHGWEASISSDDVSARITVAHTEMTKGLEYDSVIVLDPAAIADESLGNMYVALTRATKHVTVLGRGELPEGL